MCAPVVPNSVNLNNDIFERGATPTRERFFLGAVGPEFRKKLH